MALINCSECNAQISDQAKACPHCGFENKPKVPEPKPPTPEPKKSSYTPQLIIIGVVVAFGFYAMIKKDIDKSRSGQSTYTSSSSYSGPSVNSYEPELPKPGSQWLYSTSTDKLTNKTSYFALVKSSNLVNFDFPYKGPQRGTLQLRTHPRYGKDLIFSIEKGQLLCSSYDGCNVVVSFDGKDPVRYEASGPDSHSTELLFISNYSAFAGNMLKSKKVVIGVNVYKEGTQTFEFDVSDFSVEKYRPKSN